MALGTHPAATGDVGISAVNILVGKTNDAGATTQPGDDVTFTVTITNTGDSPITITSITDSIDGGAEFNVCAGLIGDTVQPAASVDCMFTLPGYAPAAGVTKENTVRVEASSLAPTGKFLVADEDTIDNANDYYLNGPPGTGVLSDWNDTDVNDGALPGPPDESGPNPARRTPLDFFSDPDNIGDTITIQSGHNTDVAFLEIDDPPRTTSGDAFCGTGLWSGQGPTSDGIRNFLGDPGAPWPHNVGPGLGTGADKEKCLDKVPGNALDTDAEIEALIGQQICVLVKDDDASFDASQNPDLLNLQGNYLGVAAFEVIGVLDPDDPNFPDEWGSNQLPALVITILDPLEVCGQAQVAGSAQSFVTIPEGPTGSLDVVKMVDGEGDPEPGTTFTVDVDCPGDDFDRTLVFDENGLLQSGGPLPITGIPAGDVCTVSETDDGDADSVTIDPPDGEVTIVENDTATVTVTNTFDKEVGSLDVDKVVVGDPGQGTQFTITVDCDGEEFDRTLVFNADESLDSGGPLPITDIPLGTQCEVTETNNGGADDVAYDPGGANAPTVTIENEGQTVTVTVTNTFFGEGSLDVDKVVDGDAGQDNSFTVFVNCDGDAFDETLIFDEDGNLTSGTSPITGIPIGTQCTVTETDDGGADLVTYDPNGGSSTDPPTVTIETDGQTITITITNTFNVRTGNLDVDKVVDGDAGQGNSFTVFVDCDGTEFDETLVFDEDGNLTSGTNPITGIPLDTDCTVTETDDGGADSVTYDPDGGTPSDPPTVTIETEGQTVTVTITNTFDEEVGQLDVVKDVIGDPAPGTEFTIFVDCDGDDFDQFLVFDENGNLTSGTTPITGIPLGTDCTVTETEDGGADSVTYDPDGGTPSDPPTVTIDIEGDTVTVTVTNVFEEDGDDGDGDGDDDGDDGDGDDDGDDEDASLPSTGAGASGLLKIGVWLVMMGAALVFSSRRSGGDGRERDPLPEPPDDDGRGGGAHARRPSTSSGAVGLLRAWMLPLVLGSTLLFLTRRHKKH